MAAERLAVLQARDNFAEILHRVATAKARFIVHRYGRELAAIVPVEDLQRAAVGPPAETGKRGLSRRASTARKR